MVDTLKKKFLTGSYTVPEPCSPGLPIEYTFSKPMDRTIDYDKPRIGLAISFNIHNRGELERRKSLAYDKEER